MKFEFHHYHHADPQLIAAINGVMAQNSIILTKVAQLMSVVDDLKAQVSKNTEVISSAKTLIVGLKTSLDNAIAQLPDTSALTELSAQLATDDQALADAVAANTPAAPAPSA